MLNNPDSLLPVRVVPHDFREQPMVVVGLPDKKLDRGDSVPVRVPPRIARFVEQLCGTAVVAGTNSSAVEPEPHIHILALVAERSPAATQVIGCAGLGEPEPHLVETLGCCTPTRNIRRIAPEPVRRQIPKASERHFERY